MGRGEEGAQSKARSASAGAALAQAGGKAAKTRPRRRSATCGLRSCSASFCFSSRPPARPRGTRARVTASTTAPRPRILLQNQSGQEPSSQTRTCAHPRGGTSYRCSASGQAPATTHTRSSHAAGADMVMVVLKGIHRCQSLSCVTSAASRPQPVLWWDTGAQYQDFCHS